MQPRYDPPIAWCANLCGEQASLSADCFAIACRAMVDFRKGHDGLAALVQSHLKMRPFDGAVYVFRAKRVDRLKMIWWDGTGLVMAYKRLEQNAFKWPAIRDGVLRLDPAQFEALFAGLDWRRVTSLEAQPPAAAE